MKVKILFIITILSILLLIGCANKEIKDQISPEHQNTIIKQTINNLNFNDDSNIKFARFNDDLLWMLASEKGGYSVRTVSIDIFKDYENTDILEVSSIIINETQAGEVSGFNVNDNITITTTSEEILTITQFDKNTNKIYDNQIEMLSSGTVDVISTVIDNNGLLYVAWKNVDSSENFITVFSSNGEELFVLTCKNEQINGIALSENVPIALIDGTQLRTINLSEKSWGESVNLNAAYISIEYDSNNMLYLTTYQQFLKYDFQNNTTARLIDFRITDIIPLWTVPISETDYLVGSPTGVHLISSKHEEAPIELGSKEIINLALTEQSMPSYVHNMVNRFNNEHDNYFMNIIEISEDNQQRFITELAVGMVPDIIFYNSAFDSLRRTIPAHRLATQGYLADLYEFIDEDPELHRESFIPALLEAAAMDGSLYELPHEFWIDVAVGNATLLGSEMGWTFDELLNILDETGFEGYLLDKNQTKRTVLYSMLCFTLDDYIDWNNGEVYFDTPDFMKLLEVINKYAPAVSAGESFNEWDEIAEGRQLMMYQTMSEPNFLQIFDFHFNEMVPIGFPVSEGVGNAFKFDSSFVISSTSEYKDIAWQFIREVYSVEFWENNMGLFPSNAAALNKWLSITDNDWWIGLDDTTIIIDGNTPYDVERTKNIINNTTRIAREEWSLMDIISEEADAYFNGLRNIENTVKVIQNRVQTYVWEQIK